MEILKKLFLTDGSHSKREVDMKNGEMSEEKKKSPSFNCGLFKNRFHNFTCFGREARGNPFAQVFHTTFSRWARYETPRAAGIACGDFTQGS
jgi:hypothetical protein